MESVKFNGLVYGGSGAVGRMVTKYCCESEQWGKIFVVTRRTIPLFEEIKKSANGDKLELIMTQDIMDEDKVAEAISGTTIHAVFNLLGCRLGKGKVLFTQIDKTFVVQSCKFAHKINAVLFSHVTTVNASKDSMFLYLRVKGECEEELKKIKMKNSKFNVHTQLINNTFIFKENLKLITQKIS